ncbi:TPA: hypothetical protein EYN98_11930 [Candidatus Poribacteria bacterium]|nr:hypothetical protein [Candidatus Poribacteria bacterium]HIA66745.1 hypothetical protein [Candidatus Poribacteria bacterium]HIB88596.1 hypothetical protein [Candidatus Poribacteria bacterium]HIB99127.1 hypothetical protein [Candidatus Poribacteria bacterium]HIN27297.1 hypothetical protein [Candidatus Poribacteria bacterium]
MPGSHLGGYHGTKDFLQSITQGKEKEAPEAVPAITKPGDVVFHSNSIVHGSFWSRSPDYRRILYFHWDNSEDTLLKAPDEANRKVYV